MYNGNPRPTRDYDAYQSASTGQRAPSRMVKVGGMYIKPLYLGIAAVVAILLVAFIVFQMLNAALVMHFSLAAGVLLLLANVRELMGQSYNRHNNTALLNIMIGASLLAAWASQIFGAFLWLPAVLLLLLATPLALGRAQVYTQYVNTGRVMLGRAIDGVRRSQGR